VILIEAAFDSEGRLSPLTLLADELVLVLQPNAASITPPMRASSGFTTRTA